MANTSKPGRTSSIRIREADLKGDCARLNRRLDLMEQTVVEGAVTGGGGASSSSGGGGGGGGGTTTPPAPNITSATVTVEYSCPFNDSMFDFAITINIPVAALLIDNLKKIRVHNSLTDTDVLVLAQPEAGWASPVAVTTELFPQTRADQPGTLTFNCENDNGDTTPLPVVVTFTVKKSAVIGFTFAGEIGERFIDPSDYPTRLVSCMIGFNPTLFGDIVPQSVYFLRSLDDGATWTGIGFQRLKNAGDQIQVQSLAPGVDSTWRIAACTGALAASSIDVTSGNIATLFPGIVISDGFPVAALELPSATLITDAQVAMANPTNPGDYPYNAVRGDDSQYWKIPYIEVQDRPAVNEAEAFFLRVTVQDLDAAHNPVASEHPFAGDQVSATGQTNTYGPLMGEYGTDGITIVRTGNIAYVRFRIYLCNRVDQTEFSFQNPLCASLQIRYGGGAGYVDVLVSAGGGVPAAPGTILGPVTGFTFVGEVNSRYASDPDRLVHLTIGFVPVSPVPQPITYFISADSGATWVWIGSQRMQTVGQRLLVDRLAPGQTSQWMVAAVAGNLGGDPVPISDASLSTLYAGVVRSTMFQVLGLTVAGASTGITATIGTCSNVVSADGFTQYGVIPGVVYRDPVGTLFFFVRITVQNLDSAHNPLTTEQAHGGTQITGGQHTENALPITYIPGLAYMRYRFYLANRNSQGDGDFSDSSTNTLQMVSYNGQVPALYWDVPITIPPFTPISPTDSFNVLSVTASEVGPKYQDEKAGLHTVIGIVPVIDHDYSSPRAVTIWLDYGTGIKTWQGPFALTNQGQVIRIGDKITNAQGVTTNGDIYVPANTAQGSWVCYCAPGHIDKGIDPTPYKSARFTVTPLAPALPNGTTNAQFLTNPATGDVIDYSKYDPGVWYWEYYCLTLTPPTIAFDPNYWFTLVTVQKGGIINGVWTQAPDSEGINQDPLLHFLGRKHVEINQLPGVSGGQTTVLKKFGNDPATWFIPPAQNEDLSPYLYRTFRFWLYNVSRLGTDTSGSGGDGTYTLQTGAWPGGADHFDLSPLPKNGSLDIRAANPATIALPLTGGNGKPLTIPAYNPSDGTGGIGTGYLGPQSVQAVNMAQNSITVANAALAAGSVVDPNIVTLGINKVTYGVSVFAGDVVLTRGANNPTIYLKIATTSPDLRQNPTGIYLFGQGDTTNGASGLTTKPYTVIQSTGIGLFQGGAGATPGSSVFLDGGAGAITIYNQNGDLTKPYLTINSAGILIANSGNSFAVNSNSMAFVDTGLGNRIDTSSAGITLGHGLNPDGTFATSANKLVISATQMQFSVAGSSRITIDSVAGSVTISNGGTASVVITASTVTITNGGLSAGTITGTSISGGTITGTTITGGSLTITAAPVTINIDGTNYVKVHSSASSVTCTMSGDTFRTEKTSSPFNQFAQLSPASLTISAADGVTSSLLTSAGLSFTPPAGGLITAIDSNIIWRRGVQCADHVFGNDFGISSVGVGWPQTSTAPSNPGGPGPGAAQGVWQSFATGAGKTVYVCGGLIMNVV